MDVKLGSNFFKNELKNYANFGLAFYREFVQNSVDAGSKLIEFDVKQENDSKKAIVVIKDDGEGMGEKIIKDVYLTLGETTKQSSESCGGMARARQLTTFAHDVWSIRTQDCFVEGSGGSYEIKTGQPFVKGCTMEIHVDAVDKYGYRIDMLSSLYSYLEMCQLNCEVKVNGLEFKNPLYRRKLTRELEIGNIYVNKSSDLKNMLFVRVKGMLMFSKNIRPPCCVILELNPEMSRKILVSNRDSINWEHDRTLSDFLAELNIDTNSALKDRSQRWTKRFGSSVKLFNAKKENFVFSNDTHKTIQNKEAALVSNVENTKGKDINLQLSDKIALVQKIKEEIGENSNDISFELDGKSKEELMDLFDFDTIVSEKNFEGFKKQEIVKKEESYIIYADTDNDKIKKVISKFEPQNLDGKRLKLLKIWEIACQEVLKIRSKDRDEEIRWMSGFNFSSELALLKTDNSVHYILFRPVDDNGLLAYSINDKDSLLKLLVYAIHEICHISYTYHDEDFAAHLTDLTYKVSGNLSEILNAMKNC